MSYQAAFQILVIMIISFSFLLLVKQLECRIKVSRANGWFVPTARQINKNIKLLSGYEQMHGVNTAYSVFNKINTAHISTPSSIARWSKVKATVHNRQLQSEVYKVCRGTKSTLLDGVSSVSTPLRQPTQNGAFKHLRRMRLIFTACLHDH